MTQTKIQQPNPQIFTIWNDEIEGRIDPCFYSPEFIKLRDKISKLKFDYLGNIINFSHEIWNQKDMYDKIFPYIEISAVCIETGEIKNVVYLSKNNAPSRAKMIIRKDDIIVSTTRPHRGAIAHIDNSKNNFIASTGFAILRELKNKKVKRDYLFEILRMNFCLDQMLQRSSGGNYPAITEEELKKIQIPLPPLPIQNKIVSIMSKVYEEKKRKEIKAEEILNSIDDYVLKELKIKMPEIKKDMVFEVWSDKMKSRIDSEYYQNFYKTFFSEIEKSKFPKEPLGNVTEFIMNGRTPAKENYVNSGNGVPIIKAGTASGKMVNLKKLGYVKNNFQGKQTAKKGDIFILSSAHQAEYVGKNVSLLDQEPKQKTYFVGELVGIRANQEKYLSRYLFSFLSTQFIFILMNREKRGQTSHLYPADLKNLPIPIPPLNIQKKIAEKIERCYSQSKTLQKEAKEVLENAKEKVEEMILK